MADLVDKVDEVELSDSEEENEEEVTEKKEEVMDLSNPDVVTKYKTAAGITDKALQFVASQCVDGASIIEICNSGETVITGGLSAVYGKKVNGKAVDKGIAFPVCVSVNEIVSNNSPLSSEVQAPLKAGDIVKIDLGCHIDGYIALAGHTFICGEKADSVPKQVAPVVSDVATAAYNAMLVAVSMIKEGGKGSEVTAAIQAVADAYEVNPLFKIRMTQMKRFVIEGPKEIALRGPDVDAEEEKCKEAEFEKYEVYAIDVAMSTGEGRVKEGEGRTTIYKKNVDKKFSLRMKASRSLLNEITKKSPTMPFSLRQFDEKSAKMGITELTVNNLVSAYPVLVENKGVEVARFQTTVLILPSGPAKVTGMPMPAYFNSEKTLNEEAQTVLDALAAAEAKTLAKKLKKKSSKKKK
ncbi:hypothetical protein ScalyP_jg5788 [Parmales sp. scaly parma]|nr:hypothetical protein ScalyP_jg5788 [Parmales sp. scaly parma]